MKAKRIRPSFAPNPAFDREEAARVTALGQRYDVPHTIPNVMGEIVDDPLCWIHCLPGYGNSAPICEPVDDECRARVDAERLLMEGRKEQLRSDAARANPATAYGRHLIDMAKRWGVWDEPEPEEEDES